MWWWREQSTCNQFFSHFTLFYIHPSHFYPLIASYVFSSLVIDSRDQIFLYFGETQSIASHCLSYLQRCIIGGMRMNVYSTLRFIHFFIRLFCYYILVGVSSCCNDWVSSSFHFSLFNSSLFHFTLWIEFCVQRTVSDTIVSYSSPTPHSLHWIKTRRTVFWNVNPPSLPRSLTE